MSLLLRCCLHMMLLGCAASIQSCWEVSRHIICCRNLMAKQDLKELGFRTEEQQQAAAAQSSKPDNNADKQKQGFIAGVRR